MADPRCTPGCLNYETHPKGFPDVPNPAAEEIPYYTPAQNPPSGTAIDPQPSGNPIPKLFQPIKLRGLALQNRIMVSPMCQYSADDGHFTDWHVTHLGGITQRGPGFTLIEATAVVPEGRITPQDSGLWKDSQIEPLKRVVDFAHSQGQKIGIQLAHAGRKASTVAPWLNRKGTATESVGGWPDNVYAPSAIAFDESSPCPKAMTLEDIENLKQAWVAAVKRSVTAGFDAIEVHAAHGYLFHSFYSPAANFRTDKYGGSFENRIRLLLEIIELTRANVPDSMPIFVRFTGSDWLESEDFPSWRIEDCVELAKIMAKTGHVDFFDISSGACHPKQKITSSPGYQGKFSKEVKEATKEYGIPVGVVGMLTEAKLANELLENGTADIAVVGRAFQKNPGLVWAWADQLGVEIRVANQIGWGFGQKVGVGAKH